MDEMCRALIKSGDKLFSKRLSLDSLWQEIAEQFYPERAQFTSTLNLGEDFASHLMTSVPVIMRREMGDYFSAVLRRGQWFGLTTRRDEPQDNAAREHLEWMAATQRRAMYAAPTNFNRAAKEGDQDYVTFGQAGLSCEMNRDRTDLLYRCWHLKDLVWAENYENQIDTFHLKYKISAKSLVKMFPKTVDQRVKTIVKQDPDKEINCRRIIVPADDYERQKGKRWITPYVSIIIDIEHETILEDVGSWTKVFIVPRWQTMSGSQYAYSPATMAGLPEARLIQQMTLVLLEAGEKAVDPPMIAYKEVLRSDLDTRAGGLSWMDAAYDERMGDPVRPLYNDRHGIPTGFEMREDIRANINSAFHLDKLSLPPMNDMTAYEFSQRIKDHARKIIPIFEPRESSYEGALCEITFETLMRNGAFTKRETPESLSGKDIDFKFQSPVQSTEDAEMFAQYRQVSELLVQSIALDETLVSDIDVRQAFRDAIKGTGAPADWLNDEIEVEQAVQAIMDQKQSLQMMQELGQGAEVGEKVGKAVQAVEGIA